MAVKKWPERLKAVRQDKPDFGLCNRPNVKERKDFFICNQNYKPITNCNH